VPEPPSLFDRPVRPDVDGYLARATLQGAKGAAMLTRLDDKADPLNLTTDDLPDGQKAERLC